ncbi:MAG TPA: carbohydrate ABC transporter permease [Ktedonosporobacter sp.]|nr:carbohydrate ABC transporter permease [Ktedonosporobacter sp.]
MLSISARRTGPRRYRSRKSLYRAIIHVVLCLFSLAFLLPLLLVVIVSFTDEKALDQNGYSLFPTKWSLEAYKFIMVDPGQIISAYGVTVFATVVGTIMSLLIVSLLAYVLARKDFKFRKAFSFYVFFTLLFNGGLVPWYILITQYLHLQDTLAALIIPYLVSAWNVLLLRTYFASLPHELIDAAKIDGAGEWRIFFQLVVPLSTPALATVGLLTMLVYWNDWWLGLLFINNPNLVPLQYLLYRISTDIDFLSTNPQTVGLAPPVEAVRMAMAVLAIGPIVFAFLFVQKYFIRGITLGGLKGD